jgi:hypothetical protein
MNTRIASLLKKRKKSNPEEHEETQRLKKECCTFPLLLEERGLFRNGICNT